jgi:hypothetical protein
VLCDARVDCPTRWPLPKKRPRDTRSDRSLPTRTEARADSIRPCRTSPHRGQSPGTTSALLFTPTAETAVALVEARLRASLPTEAVRFARSQRRSFSYGSARSLPRTPPTPTDHPAPEGPVWLAPSVRERTRALRGRRSVPSVTAARAEAPLVCLTEAKHSADERSPRARRCATWEMTLRPKPPSHLLLAAPRSQASTSPATNPVCVRGRTYARTAMYEPEHQKMSIPHSRRERLEIETGSHQGIEDAFLRFVAFQRNQSQWSERAGLPRRHHPLSGFLTLSAVFSHRGLVALFRATPAHRLSTFRAFSARASRSASRHPLLSCH